MSILCFLTMSIGDVVRLSVFGTNIIIINSHKAAHDLLDKKSLIFSDRPNLPLVEEVCVDNNLLWHNSNIV